MNSHISKIESLKAQIISLEEDLKAHIFRVINRVAEEKQLNRISDHIFLVRFSELQDVWDPNFHDWRKSAAFLLSKLETKNPTQMYDYIVSLYAKKEKYRNVIQVPYRIYSNYAHFTVYADAKFAIDSEFIKRIIEELKDLH